MGGLPSFLCEGSLFCRREGLLSASALHHAVCFALISTDFSVQLAMFSAKFAAVSSGLASFSRELFAAAHFAFALVFQSFAFANERTSLANHLHTSCTTETFTSSNHSATTASHLATSSLELAAFDAALFALHHHALALALELDASAFDASLLVEELAGFLSVFACFSFQSLLRDRFPCEGLGVGCAHPCDKQEHKCQADTSGHLNDLFHCLSPTWVVFLLKSVPSWVTVSSC